jgi:sulfatase modifying factor 1
LKTRVLIAVAAALAIASTRGADAAPAPDRAHIGGATIATILPPAPDQKTVQVAAFDMDRTPVTNAEFAAFVAREPRWRRDRIARVFADDGYLRQWSSPVAPSPGTAQQPVVGVSWFAADAYCRAQGARLPTWYEWELVAAASATAADARGDPAWRQAILDWYARPATAALPEVGKSAANLYGVRDVHGVVWEWVLDLAAMMVTADNRAQNDPDLLKFCGTGALTMEQKENYAMLMRIATLSSMQASYTSSSMGFRCVVGPEPRP